MLERLSTLMSGIRSGGSGFVLHKGDAFRMFGLLSRVEGGQWSMVTHDPRPDFAAGAFPARKMALRILPGSNTLMEPSRLQT